MSMSLISILCQRLEARAERWTTDDLRCRSCLHPVAARCSHDTDEDNPTHRRRLTSARLLPTVRSSGVQSDVRQSAGPITKVIGFCLFRVTMGGCLASPWCRPSAMRRDQFGPGPRELGVARRAPPHRVRAASFLEQLEVRFLRARWPT